MKILNSIMTASAALALVACGGNDERQVALAIAVSGANANALTVVTTTPSADGLTLSDGTNTLVITTAEVVLREIELKRDDVTDCGSGGILATQALTAEGSDDPADDPADDAAEAEDDAEDEAAEDDGNDDDACEKFETGPRLVSLPLDGSVSSQVVTAVPEGTYDRLEFEIHKLSDDNGSDILRDRPDLADVSIRIVGTYNGAEFVFVSDESFEQRVDLNPPIVVGADSTDVNVTLAIDLARWFTNEQGMLVDPSVAEDDIEDGIDGTFACFEDDDRDGSDDDSEDDVGDDHGGDDGVDDSADDSIDDSTDDDGVDDSSGGNSGSGSGSGI